MSTTEPKLQSPGKETQRRKTLIFWEQGSRPVQQEKQKETFHLGTEQCNEDYKGKVFHGHCLPVEAQVGTLLGAGASAGHRCWTQSGSSLEN